MGVETWVMVAVLISATGLAFAVAAQDSSIGMGATCGSGALRIETGLTITAFAVVLVALFVVPARWEPPYSGAGSFFFAAVEFHESSGRAAAAVGVFAAMLSACLVTLACTFLNRPVAAISIAATAFIAVGLSNDALSIDPVLVGLVIAAAFVAPLVAALIGYGIFATVMRQVHFARSIRRGTRLWLPILACLAILLIGGLTFMMADITWLKSDEVATVSLWAAGALVLGTALMITLVLALLISRRRNWPGEDVAGAEGAFSPLASATGIALNALATGFQTLILVSPAVYVVAWAGAGSGIGVTGLLGAAGATLEWKLTVLVPCLVGLVLGVLFLGHRVSATVGQDISGLTPSQAVGANLASGGVLAAAAAFGIPPSGSATAFGSACGVTVARGFKRLNGRTVLLTLLAWGVAPVSAGLLALLLNLAGLAITV